MLFIHYIKLILTNLTVNDKMGYLIFFQLLLLNFDKEVNLILIFISNV